MPRPRAGGQSSRPTRLLGYRVPAPCWFPGPRISLSQQSSVEAAGLGRPSDLHACPVIGPSGFTGRKGCPADGMLQVGVGLSPLSHTRTGSPMGRREGRGMNSHSEEEGSELSLSLSGQN